MIVRYIVEISEDDVITYQSYYLTAMINDFELRLCKISNPHPGLTPGMALLAVARGLDFHGWYQKFSVHNNLLQCVGL